MSHGHRANVRDGAPGCDGTVMSEPSDTMGHMATHLDLDDVVALAAIVTAMLGRPLTPDESSRLKAAYQRSDSLSALAGQIAA